jgi:CheY-like chemotaxis protein
MAIILYVEDHPPARMLMEAIVSEMTTHQLAVAGSGAEARDIARTLKPALYIIDLDLPDTNGLELAQTLKTIHVAPMVVVSAYAEAVKESSINALAMTYLSKPLEPNHVARIIERSLA